MCRKAPSRCNWALNVIRQSCGALTHINTYDYICCIYAENTLVFSHDFLKAHINSLYNKLAQYEYTLVLRQLYSIKMQSAHTHARVPFSMSHVSVVWSTRWGMHSIVALGISEHWGGHFCTFERYHSDTIWCFFQPHWPNVTAFSFYISMSVLICMCIVQAREQWTLAQTFELLRFWPSQNWHHVYNWLVTVQIWHLFIITFVDLKFRILGNNNMTLVHVGRNRLGAWIRFG